MKTSLIFNSVDAVKKSKSHDFTISFTPEINLPPNKEYFLALDQLNMSYSWYNISNEYDNKQIKYSHDSGTTWSAVTFPSGNFSYQDMNYFLQEVIKRNNHKVSDTEVGLSLVFVPSVFKVLITLSQGYELDLREGLFNELIGFNKEIVKTSTYSQKLPNITNSVDQIMLRCSLLSDSIVSGIHSDVLYQFSVDNLPLSYPFHVEPRRALYMKINSSNIKQIRIYITDIYDRPIDLNEIPVNMTFLLSDEN